MKKKAKLKFFYAKQSVILFGKSKQIGDAEIWK